MGTPRFRRVGFVGMFEVIAETTQMLRRKGKWCSWGKRCGAMNVPLGDTSNPPPPKFKCMNSENNRGMGSACSATLLVPDGGPYGNNGGKHDFYTNHYNSMH